MTLYDKDIESGDILVMCSDGILESNDELTNKEIWVKELLENIETEKIRDDITKRERIVLNVENFKYISNGIKSKLKNSINLKSLSPITNYNYYSLYVDTISKSCQELSNNNIAIDGKYGSGKSSVINTFIEKNNKKFVFLNVSFAKFSNSDIDENKIMDQIYQEILIHDVKKPNYFFGILISGLLFSIFILLNTIKSIIVFDNFIHLLFSIIFASFFFIIILIILLH